MILDKLQKSAQYNDNWEVTRLARKVSEEASAWLKVHGNLLKVKRHLGEMVKPGTTWQGGWEGKRLIPHKPGEALVKLWIEPKVNNVVNKRVFEKLSEHLFNYIDTYYASRSIYFHTWLTIIPERIPGVTETSFIKEITKEVLV